MFGETQSHKIEKVIKKALKTINKEIYNDNYMLGRYVIRDCFHQISKTKEKGLLVSYCFEYIDKATKTRKFYGLGSAEELTEITVEKFVQKLRNLLNTFIAGVPGQKDKILQEKKVDYRKVKID